MGASSKNDVEHLNQLAAFLKVKPGKIILNEDKLPVVAKKSNPGYSNVILQFIKESKSDLNGSNHLERSEVRQWVEYAVVYAAQTGSNSNNIQVLKELNSVLASKTYLVSQRLTVADVFLYYVLHSLMDNLVSSDKEKYIHVSRWFDNLQQDHFICQSNKIVDFRTNYLANTVPAQ